MTTCRTPRGARSVSYTHLMCIRDRHGAKLDLVGQAEERIHLVKELDDVLYLVLHLIPGHEDVRIVPVSYTHLDVYKRQLKTRSGRTHDILIGLGGVWLDGEIYDGKGIPYI